MTIDKTFFQMSVRPCGRDIYNGVNSVTTWSIYSLCAGSIVPIDDTFTTWKCTACEHVTQKDKKKHK